MERVIIAGALVIVAVVAALLIQRRKPAAPTQPRNFDVPAQVDRADFAGADLPWLVAVFTSSTCGSCERATAKAAVLASSLVAYEEIPYQSRKDLHERYKIDIVPMIVAADEKGVVRASFIGVPTATDLWAAVAEARQPGVSPEPDLGRGSS
ncbi:MAG: hypothetical protein JOZ37_11130 [Actinobacteria bacterium]|nr:hypothetical protein [Actinomycetota bacterium]MBV9933196.1 hypothetical protein [Actinomycetota bacterium]